jgi:hypothetical protein
MSELRREHRLYLLLEQGIGAGVVNFVLNAGIAWATFRSLAHVPLWGQQSIAGDVIGTTLLLPLITTLIVAALTRRALATGRFPRLSGTRRLARLPARPLARGLVLGLACTVLVAPPIIVALTKLGVAELELASFVWAKAWFAGILGMLVTPFIAFAALDDQRQGVRVPAPRSGE